MFPHMIGLEFPSLEGPETNYSDEECLLSGTISSPCCLKKKSHHSGAECRESLSELSTVREKALQ